MLLQSSLGPCTALHCTALHTSVNSSNDSNNDMAFKKTTMTDALSVKKIKKIKSLSKRWCSTRGDLETGDEKGTRLWTRCDEKNKRHGRITNRREDEDSYKVVPRSTSAATRYPNATLWHRLSSAANRLLLLLEVFLLLFRVFVISFSLYFSASPSPSPTVVDVRHHTITNVVSNRNPSGSARENRFQRHRRTEQGSWAGGWFAHL